MKIYYFMGSFKDISHPEIIMILASVRNSKKITLKTIRLYSPGRESKEVPPIYVYVNLREHRDFGKLYEKYKEFNIEGIIVDDIAIGRAQARYNVEEVLKKVCTRFGYVKDDDQRKIKIREHGDDRKGKVLVNPVDIYEYERHLAEHSEKEGIHVATAHEEPDWWWITKGKTKLSTKGKAMAGNYIYCMQNLIYDENTFELPAAHGFRTLEDVGQSFSLLYDLGTGELRDPPRLLKDNWLGVVANRTSFRNNIDKELEILLGTFGPEIMRRHCPHLLKIGNVDIHDGR